MLTISHPCQDVLLTRRTALLPHFPCFVPATPQFVQQLFLISLEGVIMEEIGIIVEDKGNFAIVKIEKNDRAGCKGCGLCRTGRDGGLYIESENLIGAETGEKVKVEIPGESIFIATVFIYGIPLAGFILGIVLASVIENVILKILCFIFIFGGSTFMGLNLGEKFGKREKPKITGRE